MSSTARRTRSTLPLEPNAPSKNTSSSSVHFSAPLLGHATNESHRILPPGQTLPGLTKVESKLLRQKQRQLASTAALSLSYCSANPYRQNALESTLIFAQHEAGTAVCIDPAGWLLTCSHCIGETEDEWQANKCKWLLFYDGLAVRAECRAWNSAQDLAFLKVIAIESIEGSNGNVPSFSCIPLAADNPKIWKPIFCIGQPGADDLESETKRKTTYNLVEISEGKYCGMVKGADPHNNAEIGSLKHSAWTYWGHSGAPLLNADDSSLIGLHSSWDEKTGMRHGIPLIAIKAFLDEHLVGFPKSSTSQSIVSEDFQS